MYNLAKMELYKVFKSISTWVIIAVVIAFGAFSAVMTNFDLGLMEGDQSSEEFFDNQSIIQSAEYDEEVSAHIGIYVDTNYDWINGNINIAEYTVILLQSSIYLILATIFTAVFVHSEYQNGYIKNIAGQIRFKGKLILAKLPALLLFNVIMFALVYLTSVLFVRIFIGTVDLSITVSMAKLILMQFLLHFAFCCVIMMLTSVTESKAIGIAVGLLCGGGISTLIWHGINILVSQLFDNSTFDVGEYTIVQNVQLLGTSFDFDNTAKILLVGSFFIVISIGIAMVVVNNRDVK